MESLLRTVPERIMKIARGIMMLIYRCVRVTHSTLTGWPAVLYYGENTSVRIKESHSELLKVLAANACDSQTLQAELRTAI